MSVTGSAKIKSAEVRELAREMGLEIADKHDSQDICFVPQGSYATVVQKLRPGAADPGEIVHLDGRVMGRHQGIIHYTIGQRRGLGVGGESEPLFVVRLEPETRRVIVGPKAALARDRVILRDLNWLPGEPLAPSGRRVEVKLRSASEPAAATLYPRAGGAEVVLDTAQFGISPGQAAVCYEGTRVLGGGWIAAAESRLAA